MPKVSIVIPVYNVEKYLRECLESVRNQTLKEIEIICIDDGSTDTSGKILDEYTKLDKRFRVIHKQNEGYGKAMNVGIEMAAAPYVGIVESDDMVAPDMYENLLILMEKMQVDVLKTDFYEFYDNGEGAYIKEYTPLIFYEHLQTLYGRVCNVEEHEEVFLFHRYTWSGLYNKEFLEKNHITHNETPGASYQDNGFWFQTMVKAKRMCFVKEAFYYYRIDNPNSSMNSKVKAFSICEEYDFVRKKLKQMGDAGRKYYKWVSYIKIVDCLNIIARVSDEYKKKLAERIKNEFLTAVSLGEIDASLYNNDRKIKIFDVLADPESYAEREITRRAKIEDIVKNYDTIILYGAGKIGHAAQRLLKEGRMNTKIKYFAVSNMEQNSEIAAGIPVRKIDDLLDYIECALVIITVGRRYIQEVQNTLNILGFKHVVLFEDLCGRE